MRGNQLDTSNSRRSSVWRKWDLHTHTPASILNLEIREEA